MRLINIKFKDKFTNNMIKSFRIFESYNEIKSICDRHNIKNWELNSETGLVNVAGGVNISNSELTRIPVKFGRVEGNFYCNNNQLTHLEGAPRSVGGDFYCSNSQLTTLEGAPQSVGGDFYCSNNQLTSLEGGPRSVGRDFYCYNNKLITLEGAPQSVGGDFGCSNNQLATLGGAPKSLGRNFYCSNNQIKDFKVPEYSLNEEMKFYCNGNPIYEIYKLFNTPKCIDLINEYEVIGGDIISRVRLEEVFLELGLVVPNLKIDFHASKNWKLV